MKNSILVALAILVWPAALLGLGVLSADVRNRFTQTVAQPENTFLHEGLPRGELQEHERHTKRVEKFLGYWFYQELLAMNEQDGKRLSAVLADPQTFKPHTTKFCGGFHPDYAVHFQRGQDRYFALICITCHEVALNGPGLNQRFDLEDKAYETLTKILSGYRKNRPENKIPASQPSTAPTTTNPS